METCQAHVSHNLHVILPLWQLQTQEPLNVRDLRHCLINTPPPRFEFGGEMTCSRSHRVTNLYLLFLLADELFLSPVQWGPQSCLPRQCLVETSHPGLALPCGHLWAAAPPLHLAVLDHYVPRVLWGPREQMSPRSVTLAWTWSVGIVTPQTFLLLGCFFTYSATLG